MKRLTVKGVEKELLKNYGYLNFDVDTFISACRIMAKRYTVNTVSVYRFMIGEHAGIEGLHLQSYGFCTAAGRDFRDEFKGVYDELLHDQ